MSLPLTTQMFTHNAYMLFILITEMLLILMTQILLRLMTQMLLTLKTDVSDTDYRVYIDVTMITEI